MGENFFPKTFEWVIILIRKKSELVTVSIILPGNGWFSCKLNKTYCNFDKVWFLFYCTWSGNGSVFLLINGPALVCGWVNL